MSTEVATVDESSELTLDLTTLDTPEKRFQGLSKTFTSAMVIIAEMQKNEDWEKLTKEDGSSYKNLTDLVQDALKISDSYARRLVQTAGIFYTPLESVTVEGTVISITSTEAAKLGTDGMEQVVQEVESKIDENNTPEEQSELIKTATQDVLDQKSDFASSEFDDLDFDDDFDDFDDDFDDDSDFASSSNNSKSASSGGNEANGGSSSSEKPTANAPKASAEKQKPSDYLGPIQSIMSGGKEYKTEEDLAELEEPLRKFVETVNYLADLDPEEITSLIDEENRGATYSIRKAASNLTLIVSNAETATWVLEQI